MLEGLLASFLGYWLLGCVIKAAISRWDESRCRSTWEFNLTVHKKRLADPRLGWMPRKYHLWRERILTERLDRYRQELDLLMREQMSKPQP